MTYDLLSERLLSWRDGAGGRDKATLPGLIARLADGTLSDFPRVRAHQFHPWSMFLTQLAAIALHRAGATEPRVPEDEWRQLLLALTNGRHEPWALVVEDLSQPALFQPSVPENSLDAWCTCDAPDDMDVLLTAKNHDVKRSLIGGGDLESWVYALGTLQTVQGYPGRGYTRVARMKGGYGSRPRVGLAADVSASARFLRDVEVMLGSWLSLLERGFSNDGISLVWTEPWDGRSSLPKAALSPHFIEVCWRVRLVRTASGCTCRYTTTSARQRCVPEVETGDVGDPWIPIERATGGALTVGKNGLDYRLLTRVLFENEYEPAAAQSLRASDGDPTYFLGSVLARGQGKTEGLHERIFPIPGPVRWRLGQADTRGATGKRAASWVETAERMRRKVLFPALKALAGSGTVHPDEFDDRVDEVFFDLLFDTIDLPDDEARLSFEGRLREIACDEMQRAVDRCTAGEASLLRVISEAENLFEGCLRKQFPDLFSKRSDEGGRS